MAERAQLEQPRLPAGTFPADYAADQTRAQPGCPAGAGAGASDIQLRVADWITSFAGSMNFVYLHVVLFTVWILFVESKPWPSACRCPSLIVSLEAINVLSTFVMIGQNRQAEFQQAKADRDFNEQELELKTNTQLTREIDRLTTEVHRRVVLNTTGNGGETS